MSHPLVTILDPPDNLSYSHHGPSKLALPTSGQIHPTPKYFQNPWRSWRNPSLSDAWLAYQKGAAIALPLKHTAKRAAALENATSIPDDDPVGDRDVTFSEQDYIIDEQREDDGSIKMRSNSMLPVRVYVRPEFAIVKEEDEIEDWRDPPIQVVRPRWDDIDIDKPNVTWLGHAGTLIRLPWKRSGMCGIIFDPIFSYRCSPTQYVGPARYQNPPCSVAELPAIHVYCISHDHYDHLDYYTVVDLWKYHSDTIHFVVPLGLRPWFTSTGIPSERVTELDWWHEAILSFPSSASPDFSLKIACTPAQHRSGRGVMDHMCSLWASWCVGVVDESSGDPKQRGMQGWQGFKAYFGGDTGYRYATAPADDQEAICPAFAEISQLYGPMSLSLLPLSTGSSLPFLRTILSLSLDQYTMTSSQHCSPADALELHRIMQSQRSIGIHWGTFCDHDEARGTRIEFGRERRSRGISSNWLDAAQGPFSIADIGETLVLV